LMRRGSFSSWSTRSKAVPRPVWKLLRRWHTSETAA
jgi:hypothetical protein